MRQDHSPKIEDKCPEELRATVAALVREHDEQARRLRALEEMSRAVRAGMLVYEPAPRR